MPDTPNVNNINDESGSDPLASWKNAVIHLECAADSEHWLDRQNKIEELMPKLQSGELSLEEFGEATSGNSRDIRYHGTALFIRHNDRHYLVTARHVVFDKHSAEGAQRADLDFYKDMPFETQNDLMKSNKKRYDNHIFNIIFRVPSYNEYVSTGGIGHREFLMNLGAGPYDMVPYSYSDSELDLAVISLDMRDSKFASELIQLGYSPIPSEFIGEEPSHEGADVFTVGFPESTAVLGQIPQTRASLNWSAGAFSLPVFSFGKVSMLNELLSFYWVDMSIYPGNSGGPIIESNSLVGVVSGQAVVPMDNEDEVQSFIRIPFGKIIKAKHVKELLDIQAEKDANVGNLFHRIATE